MMRLLSYPGGAGLTLLVALAFALSACGGGEQTVTVTVPAKPAKEGGKKQGGGGELTPTDGAVTGYVDNVAAEGESLVLSGWAASSDLSEAATLVTAEVGGETVAEAVPTLKRDDVVEALGKPGVLESGFELRLPIEAVECGTPAAGITVIGSLEEESSKLLYGEGIKEAVTEAC